MLPVLHLRQRPDLLYQVWQEYAAAPAAKTPQSNFLKGCRWSPDGTCLLTASDDAMLRVFDTPQDALDMPPAAGAGGDSLAVGLAVPAGELVYDYAWYSRMNAADPATCCFAVTARAHPISLWDACSGLTRCSYRSYDAADEVSAAYALAFSPAGGTLLAGHNRRIDLFDVHRPGREYATLATHARKQGEGLQGIVSCFAYAPDGSGLFAAGSYGGGTALYDERTREALALISAHAAGVTQVQWSRDGTYLYTGARRDAAIHCWDVRYSHDLLYSLQRAAGGTNQRLQFDIEPCGRHLATGGEDGLVRCYDLRDGAEVAAWPAGADCVNALSFHPCLPLAATASGQRRYPDARSSGSGSGSGSSSDDDGDDSGGAMHAAPGENSLRIWRFSHEWVAYGEPEGGGGQQPLDSLAPDAAAGSEEPVHEQPAAAAAAAVAQLQYGVLGGDAGCVEGEE